MKRAIILILSVCILCIVGGFFVDQGQKRLASEYVEKVQAIRDCVKNEDFDRATQQFRDLDALWETDLSLLNRVTNHNYTRDVSGFLRELSTTLQAEWMSEALLVLDRVEDALLLLGEADYPSIENIL